MASILIVDDLLDLTEALRRVLEFHGHEVATAHDGVQAMRQLREKSIDVLVLDLFMPTKDGLEVLGDLKQQGLSPKILVISGGGDAGDFHGLKVAKMLGAHACLEKPFSMLTFLHEVESLLQKGGRKVDADPPAEPIP